MMEGRDRLGSLPPPRDSLVRFPTRPQWRLIPKPICSPVRPAPGGRHRRGRSRQLHGLRSSSISHGSPSLLAKDDGLDTSEPSSPTVTCAGQVKVPSPKGSSENWKKRSSWSGARRFASGLLELRCFGNFPATDVISDNDDVEDASIGNPPSESDHHHQSRDVLYNLYMILTETKDESQEKSIEDHDEDEEEESKTVAPPQNALILMRCRSAPAKSCQEEEVKKKMVATKGSRELW